MRSYSSRLTIHPALLGGLAIVGGCFSTPSSDDSGGTGSTTDTPGDTSTGVVTTTTPDPTTDGPETADTTEGPPPETTTGPASTGETTAAPSACGDGVVDGDEDCDDGNVDDGDGCSGVCTVDEGWYCDAANPSTCTTNCGDGIVGLPAEECDDGNRDPNDACTAQCLDAVCGDGVVWLDNEGCDDGNADSDDGCSDACAWEPGFVCEGEPSACFEAVFLAEGSETTSGSLWAMSTDGAVTVEIGPIGQPITGMAFHPNGTLYAVTCTQFMADNGELGRINPETGEFTAIGPLVSADGTNHPSMPDITFIGSELYGWTESGDDLVTIDVVTGQVTVITSTQGSAGTALAYNPISDTMYLAPSGSSGTLYTVDELGNVVAGPMLGGANSSVKGMAFSNGTFYAMDTQGRATDLTAINLVTFEPGTGLMTILGNLPALSIDALAIFDPANAP